MEANGSENPRAVIGGNEPPSPIEALQDDLRGRYGKLSNRQVELLAMEQRLPIKIENDAFADKIAEAIKQCKVFTVHAETNRKTEKEPFLSLERAVDGFFKRLSDPVEQLRQKLLRLHTAYATTKADAERRRLEAEAEKARKQAERDAANVKGEKTLERAVQSEEAAQAASAAAQVKPADLARARTTSGVLSTIRKTWEFEVVSADAVPREYLTVDMAAIRNAVRAATDKHGDCNLDIPGVKIFPREASVVR